MPPSAPLLNKQRLRGIKTLIHQESAPCPYGKAADPLEALLDQYGKIAQTLDPGSRLSRMSFQELEDTRASGTRKMHVLKEFFETEKAYSQALEFLLNHRISGVRSENNPDSPLPDSTLFEAMAKSSTLSKSERKFVAKMEDELRTIHEQSTRLVSALKETFEPEFEKAKNLKTAAGKGDPYASVPVSSIIKMEDRLLQSFHPKELERAYSEFIANQETLQATIAKWEKNKIRIERESPSTKFYGDCQVYNAAQGISLPCDFSSFIMRPFQRVSKYPLLIRELSKKTVKTDKSSGELQTLYQESADLIKTVNDNRSSSFQDSFIRKMSPIFKKPGSPGP